MEISSSTEGKVGKYGKECSTSEGDREKGQRLARMTVLNAFPSHFGSNRAQNKPQAVSHEIPHFPKIARNRIRGEEGRLSLLKGDRTGIGQRLPRLFCRRFNTHRQDSSGQWVSWEVDAISRDGLTVGVVWACALTWALNGDR